MSFFDRIGSFSITGVSYYWPQLQKWKNSSRAPHYCSTRVFLFLPYAGDMFGPGCLLPSSPVGGLRVFLFPTDVGDMFVSFFVISPGTGGRLLRYGVSWLASGGSRV